MVLSLETAPSSVVVSVTAGGCGANLSAGGLIVWKSDTGNSKCPDGDCSNWKVWDPGGRSIRMSPGPQ
eukprot:2311933-Lingulodinium_polyedra.AAC.1